MSWSISTFTVTLGVAALTLGAAPARTQAPQAAPPATVDVDSVGPKVGERLPDFSLPDQHGQPHSLKSILGSNGAVIVFFRSADW